VVVFVLSRRVSSCQRAPAEGLTNAGDTCGDTTTPNGYTALVRCRAIYATYVQPWTHFNGVEGMTDDDLRDASNRTGYQVGQNIDVRHNLEMISERLLLTQKESGYVYQLQVKLSWAPSVKSEAGCSLVQARARARVVLAQLIRQSWP
jgi:hypothetical protein